MTSRLPEEIYKELCVLLRERIESAEKILLSSSSDREKVENACLQGRKAVETIAYMCVVAAGHSVGMNKLPRTARTQWKPDKIFQELIKKSSNYSHLHHVR